jgi:outer membrane protein assembly factor BamD (BamD/ComL family)
MLVLVDTACSRDRIVLQLPDKASRLVLAGDVADYTAEFIEVHLTTGKPVRQYASSHVITVQTVQTKAHQKGVTLFQHGELDLAQVEFEQALAAEPRRWVQREILGWLVKIAMRLDDRAAAGQRFLQTAATEAAPREYALIPLVWGTVRIDTRLRQQARLWITGDSDLQRLLGASVLLGDAQYSDLSESELNRLARVSDRRIAELARCQLWRRRVAESDVTENELRSWEANTEQMPPELRSGPYYVLGRARLHRSEYDRAAAAFLWIPTVYNDNESLASRAALDAATALRRAGRLTEAQSLLREVTTDYGWSPAAEEARVLLAETGSP